MSRDIINRVVAATTRAKFKLLYGTVSLSIEGGYLDHSFASTISTSCSSGKSKMISLTQQEASINVLQR